MHIFIYSPDPSNRFDIATLEMSVNSVSSCDICESFYQYLRGCGFSDECIVDSFERVVYEHKEEDSNV